MERISIPSVFVIEHCLEEAQMELLFQAWDELDDALAVLRHVVTRYGLGELQAAAAEALAVLKRPIRAASTRRRRLRTRPA